MISFSVVARKLRITTDIDTNFLVNVQIRYGTRKKFKECSGGLYYYDTTNMENSTTNNQVTNYTFLNTVENKNHTSTDVKSKEQMQQECSNNS